MGLVVRAPGGHLWLHVAVQIYQTSKMSLSCVSVFYFCILFSNYKICLLQVWVPGPMCSSSHTDITNLVNWILLGENLPGLHNWISQIYAGFNSSTKNYRVCGVSLVAIIVGNHCFIFLFPLLQNVSLNKRMCAE